MNDPFADVTLLKNLSAPPAGPDVRVLYERIQDQIKAFENALTEGEEVQLWCSAPTGPMMVTDVGYHSVYMMVLRGLDREGRKAKMLVSPWALQLQIVTHSILPGEPRRSIGFSGAAQSERAK